MHFPESLFLNILEGILYFRDRQKDHKTPHQACTKNIEENNLP